MAHDAIGAHARDELGIFEPLTVRVRFRLRCVGRQLRCGSGNEYLDCGARAILLVFGTSLVFLVLLGGLATRAGGAPVTVGAMRVTLWGALAMGVTAGVGALFGTAA